MTDVKPIFSETSGDSEGRVVVDMQLFATGRTEIVVQGMGSIEGMRAWTASFNRAVAEVGPLESLWVRLDLTHFVGAPIPAQLTLVKWLVQNQHRLKKMGLIGGDTGALRVARAVHKLLPFQQRVVFYDDPDRLQAEIDAFERGEG